MTERSRFGAAHILGPGPRGSPEQRPRDREGLAPGEPRAPAVPRVIDARPFKPDDRDARETLDATGVEPGRDGQGSFVPLSAPVVIAADIDERGVERIGEECQPLGLEIATPEDSVELTHRLAIDDMLEPWLRGIRSDEKPDRTPIPGLEGPRIRPRNLEPADHRDSSGSGDVARLTAARISRLSSTSEANDSGGSEEGCS